MPQFTHWLSGCDDVLRGLLEELDELMLASKPAPQCASCYQEHLLLLISGSPSHGGQMKRERWAGEGQGVRLGELTQSEGPAWPSLRTVEKPLPSLLSLSLALLSGFSLPPSRGRQGCWDLKQWPARGGPAMAQSGACACLCCPRLGSTQGPGDRQPLEAAPAGIGILFTGQGQALRNKETEVAPIRLRQERSQRPYL